MLASSLSGKQVMSTDGQQVGQVHNLTMAPDSGALETLVVETDRNTIFGIEADADGRVQLPATVIEAARDQLIITQPSTAPDQ